MSFFFLFVLGLAVGSFLNVIALRYEEDGPLLSPSIVRGRSHCPYCRKTLKWYELVPLFSFLAQRGRCRNCQEKLSWQYPLAEFLSGLIFVLVPYALVNFKFSISNFPAPSVILWIVVFEFFLLLSLIDFRLYIIPDSINLWLAVLGIVLIFAPLTSCGGIDGSRCGSFLGYYFLIFPSINNIWLNHLSAAFLAMFFFGAVILITRGRGMGWGDFKLGGALGLIFGWPDILAVLALAFIIGALSSIVLMARGEKGMKDAVPFGPFLIIGATLVFFLGFQMTQFYFRIFGIIMQ